MWLKECVVMDKGREERAEFEANEKNKLANEGLCAELSPTLLEDSGLDGERRQSSACGSRGDSGLNREETNNQIPHFSQAI